MVGDKMKLIDFERHNNMIRYYFGDDDCNDYWGDDWNDAPYEHNAGRVYDKYIKKYIDIGYPRDCFVLTPNDTYSQSNSNWSKEDMKNRTIPCVIILDRRLAQQLDYFDSFEHWVMSYDERIKKIYFGDSLESVYDFKLNK